MGVCGGLSTMSTLALEGFTAIRDGQVAASIAYLLVTFALGLVLCVCRRVGRNASGRLLERIRRSVR